MNPRRWLREGEQLYEPRKSNYLMNGRPERCGFCSQPFPVRDGRMEAWHDGNGRYFCNEYCADAFADFGPQCK